MLTAPGLITEFLMWKSVQARRASSFPREVRGRSLWFPCGNQSPDVAGVGEFMGEVLSGLAGNNWGSEAVMKGK